MASFYAYDANGNRIKSSDERGEIEYRYDIENRLTAVTDKNGLLMTALYDGDSNRVFTATRAKRQTERQILVKVNKSPDTSAAGKKHSLFEYGFSHNIVQCLSEASIGAAKVWNRFFDMLESAIFQKKDSNQKNNRQSSKNAKTSATLNDETQKNENSAHKRANFGDVFIPQTIKEENTYYEVRNYINDVNRDYAQVLASYDENGKIRESYDYGLERLNGYRHQEGSVQTYLNDARGSITGLSNETGLQTASVNYNVQGMPQNTASNLTFGYNGEQSDITGFQYLRARYYDPKTASMLTEDTYAGDETDPLSQNRYTYARNNPINYQDPSGHFPKILSDIGNAIKKKATNVVKAVVKKGKEVVNQVTTFFTGAKKQIVKTAKAAKEVVEEKVEQAVDTVSTGYKEAKKEVKNWCDKTKKQATHVLKNVVKAAEKTTKQFCTTAKKVLDQAIDVASNIDLTKVAIGFTAIVVITALIISSGGTAAVPLAVFGEAILAESALALSFGGLTASIAKKTGSSDKEAGKEFSDTFMWSGISSAASAGYNVAKKGVEIAGPFVKQQFVRKGGEAVKDSMVDSVRQIGSGNFTIQGATADLGINFLLGDGGKSGKKLVKNSTEHLVEDVVEQEKKEIKDIDLQFFSKAAKGDAAQSATKTAEKSALKGGADFYVAPNGKTLPGQYKDWIGTNMRESLINSVDDPTLKKAISEVYRPGSIVGDGGTADIIRFEQETGILLSKSGHTQKAVDMSKYFQKLVDSGTLSPTDTKVAQDIINGLNAALGGK